MWVVNSQINNLEKTLSLELSWWKSSLCHQPDISFSWNQITKFYYNLLSTNSQKMRGRHFYWCKLFCGMTQLYCSFYNTFLITFSLNKLCNEAKVIWSSQGSCQNQNIPWHLHTWWQYPGIMKWFSCDTLLSGVTPFACDIICWEWNVIQDSFVFFHWSKKKKHCRKLWETAKRISRWIWMCREQQWKCS